MAYTSSSAILRALVQRVRANPALRASLVGGIHEGFSPEPIATYPMAIYTSVAMSYEPTWTSRLIVGLVDVTIYSRDQVEASNLDQSMLEQLDGAALTPEGQTSLICRRVNDLRNIDVDEEGRKVYGVGGSYEIWTSQNA
jgi:hypothetical protein